MNINPMTDIINYIINKYMRIFKWVDDTTLNHHIQLATCTKYQC